MHLRDEQPLDEQALNLTSMTDLVFLLLVFFLCATTFLDPERALELELPAAQSGERRQVESEELVINVSREGSFALGGRTLDAAALQRELRAAAARDPQTPITIRGDRLVHHEDIVRVMDACGQAGLVNLAVGTLEGS
ncbi:MAG: biopolymer transporter ExbD [Planctomycetaceae bacterium]|jgi:biopolymer transport protein ExbD|nr:biopolymer transporter ExbD [Planctomycetaceae bacterium]